MDGISIIIPAYNEERTITKCLDAVLKQAKGEEFEIIVVDNASTDNTFNIASRYPRVRVVQELKKSRSFARNRGAREARHEIFCFIDADIIIGDNYFKSVVKALRGPFGLIQPLVDIDFKSPFVNSFYLNHRHFCQKDIPWLTIDSAALTIKKETFLLVNGFNESLPRLEDTDLTMKVMASGYSVAVINSAVVSKIETRNIFQRLKRSFDIGKLEYQEMQKWLVVPKGKWVDYFKLEFSPYSLPRLMKFLGSLCSKDSNEIKYKPMKGWKQWTDKYMVSKSIVTVVTPEFISLRTFNCKYNFIIDEKSASFSNIYSKVLIGESFVEDCLHALINSDLTEEQKKILSNSFLSAH